MYLRGVNVSRGDMSPAAGGYGAQSCVFRAGRDSDWGTAVAIPVRSMQGDPELMEGRIHRQLQHLQPNAESTTGPQTPSPGGQSAGESHPAHEPTTCGTWPAPGGHRTAGVPKTAGSWTPTQPPASVLGSAMATSDTRTDADADTVTDTDIDTDGKSDDVYEGWGDYYFDKENFHG